jgi:hypothetical protein
MYLADDVRGRCAPLTASDLRPPSDRGARSYPSVAHPLTDAAGYVYRVRLLSTGMSIPELRWTRSSAPGQPESVEELCLREVVARIEDYEPVRTTTASILAQHADDPDVSSCRLRTELDRLLTSPIVLNRKLREAVTRETARGTTSMSEIAIRCGHTKTDSHRKTSGDTSWLARRIGLRPEHGAEHPTPWIHTDTLALITRDGLAMSSRDVEL